MVKSWFESKDASRKFIDLIYKASTKWANWDPPIPIEVGSFGDVGDKSGVFEVDGNISELKSGDGTPYYAGVPETTPIVHEFTVCSKDATGIDASVGPNANVGIADLTLANAGAQFGWQFGNKRGAVLVMRNYRIESLPQSVKRAIVDCKDDKLKGLRVVTKVYKCQAYCLYLSNKTNEKVNFQLSGQVPVPLAPGVMAGGNISCAWGSKGAEGLFQSGANEKELFTPLYEIEKIRGPRNRRDAGPPDTGGDRWDIIDLPWGPLDEDGEEEMEVLSDSGDEGFDF